MFIIMLLLFIVDGPSKPVVANNNVDAEAFAKELFKANVVEEDIVDVFANDMPLKPNKLSQMMASKLRIILEAGGDKIAIDKANGILRAELGKFIRATAKYHMDDKNVTKLLKLVQKLEPFKLYFGSDPIVQQLAKIFSNLKVSYKKRFGVIAQAEDESTTGVQQKEEAIGVENLDLNSNINEMYVDVAKMVGEERFFIVHGVLLVQNAITTLKAVTKPKVARNLIPKLIAIIENWLPSRNDFRIKSTDKQSKQNEVKSGDKEMSETPNHQGSSLRSKRATGEDKQKNEADSDKGSNSGNKKGKGKNKLEKRGNFGANKWVKYAAMLLMLVFSADAGPTHTDAASNNNFETVHFLGRRMLEEFATQHAEYFAASSSSGSIAAEPANNVNQAGDNNELDSALHIVGHGLLKHRALPPDQPPDQVKDWWARKYPECVNHDFLAQCVCYKDPTPKKCQPKWFSSDSVHNQLEPFVYLGIVLVLLALLLMVFLIAVKAFQPISKE